jgi:hypothetical protein
MNRTAVVVSSPVAMPIPGEREGIAAASTDPRSGSATASASQSIIPALQPLAQGQGQSRRACGDHDAGQYQGLGNRIRRLLQAAVGDGDQYVKDPAPITLSAISLRRRGWWTKNDQTPSRNRRIPTKPKRSCVINV